MILILVSLIFSLAFVVIWNVIDLLKWWEILIQFLGSFISVLIIILLFSLFVSIFVNKKKNDFKPKKFYVLMNYLWFDFVRVFFRVKVDYRVTVPVDYKKNYLLICNHQSNLDPFVIMKFLHKLNLGFIIKKEILKIFIIRNWAHASCFLGLDRKNNREGLKTILNTIKAVQERTICVFPEGTRSKNGELLEFKDGIFKVSQKGNVDILVCTIDKVHLVKRRFPFRSTKVIFEVSGIISKEEAKNLTTIEISEKVKNMISNSLNKIREE